LQVARRAVIVTGGARGIGATYVRALAASGAQVVIADILQQEGEALAHEVSSQPDGRAIFMWADVAKQTDATRLAHTTAETFGSIDILVNNAAIYSDLGEKKPFDRISEAEWDIVMSVNVKGPWQCAKAVLPYMQRQQHGKIINVSSSSIYAGTPGLAHYVASKAAVIGLTRSLARELGQHNICVNAIAPGLVFNEASTRLNPREYFEGALVGRAIPRLMAPRDLVGTMLFLASADSDFITGQTFVVDGGATMI
jgi:NAD(P)-dependent dehydrogenase (short-subunit alcohol dehydrogenase family)